MKRVIIESPWAEKDEAEEYLRECIQHSLKLWEAPFASHRMYTDALDDLDKWQRTLGIGAGYTWLKVADLVAFYMDYGLSSGMEQAMGYATDYIIPMEFRWLHHSVPIQYNDPFGKSLLPGPCCSWFK